MNEQSSPRSADRRSDPHLDEHLCIDLLQGFLSHAEAKRIVAHVSECPTCERLLRQRAAEDERISATRVVRSLPGGEIILEKRGSAVRSREKTENRRSRIMYRAWESLVGALRIPRYQLAAVAATAAVVVLVLVWPHGAEISGTFELRVLPSYSFDLESRDTPESQASEDLKAGLLAYDHREFRRAAELLRSVETSGLDEVNRTIRQIYLGSALAWTGRHEDAVEALEKVPLLSVPGEWGKEARWTMYVALKGSGREASADSLLRLLATKPGEIGERARRFLGP